MGNELNGLLDSSPCIFRKASFFQVVHDVPEEDCTFTPQKECYLGVDLLPTLQAFETCVSIPEEISIRTDIIFVLCLRLIPMKLKSKIEIVRILTMGTVIVSLLDGSD